MKNPISVFDTLREMYLRYLDSPFDLRYADLVEERRQLIDQDGRIYRHPLIEAVPRYKKSAETIPQVINSLLGTTWGNGEYTLDLSGMVRQFESRVAEEGVERGQAQITATNAQPSLLLEMIEKGHQQRSINLFELQLCGRLVQLLLRELQE